MGNFIGSNSHVLFNTATWNGIFSQTMQQTWGLIVDVILPLVMVVLVVALVFAVVRAVKRYQESQSFNPAAIIVVTAGLVFVGVMRANDGALLKSLIGVTW